MTARCDDYSWEWEGGPECELQLHHEGPCQATWEYHGPFVGPRLPSPPHVHNDFCGVLCRMSEQYHEMVLDSLFADPFLASFKIVTDA